MVVFTIIMFSIQKKLLVIGRSRETLSQYKQKTEVTKMVELNIRTCSRSKTHRKI